MTVFAVGLIHERGQRRPKCRQFVSFSHSRISVAAVNLNLLPGRHLSFANRQTMAIKNRGREERGEERRRGERDAVYEVFSKRLDFATPSPSGAIKSRSVIQAFREKSVLGST